MPRIKKVTTYVLRLFQFGDGAHGQLCRSGVTNVQRLLDQTIRTSRNETEIDLWVDSPGGDAHATYKLILDLRNRARLIRAVIPDCAKSAATLLVLGVDEIHMAPGADLGPLDVQIPHPDRETEMISALDVAGSLDYLNKFAFQMAIAGGAALVKFTGLPRVEVLRDTLEFAARFLQPCVAKIDPHLTRRAVSQLKVAEHYAIRMLAERNVPKQFQLSVQSATALVQRLVNEYPIHEFVIGREEARLLGLPVYDAEASYPRWAEAKASHEEFMASERAVVDVRAESQLVKNGLVPKQKGTAKRPRKAPDGVEEGNEAAPQADRHGGDRVASNGRKHVRVAVR